MTRRTAHIVLRDGSVFEGVAAGFEEPTGVQTGEFVFNTALSGYQEVITDPSYAGQVIAFTYPHLGNYGVCEDDMESVRPFCRGVVCRELTSAPSNWRSEQSLEEFLVRHRLSAIVGVDTRRLTRHLRTHGALAGAFGTADVATLSAHAATARGTDETDLVADVTTSAPYERGHGPQRVVALDYGIKRAMVNQLAQRFHVTVMPATSSADEIMAAAPDGVFLSNGPGDPAALGAQVREIEHLLGRVPIFGICLGHQLLATALGARTMKLPFGHHGSNHPVKDFATGRVEITAQNHNYAVVPDSVATPHISHVNLNDGVIEGVSVPSERCFSVQYHPEASPGPHDAHYLFARFEQMVDTKRLVA